MMETARTNDLRLGLRVEVYTLIWMTIEMAVAISAGVVARSVLLTAFGMDSLIELISGGILLWRFQVESRGGNSQSVEHAENRAAWIVAISLGLLSVYVLLASVFGLITRSKPENSLAGIAVSAAAVIVMPYLAIVKRRLAIRIKSTALAGDAINSFTCAYMAGTVLIGLVLNALFRWWWADFAAALLFLVWLVRETWEAFDELRRAKLKDGRRRI
jgi:divalent metal cation (Fe/Co/Zn/Cd) transporter